MGVDIRVGGSAKWAASSISVTEDATPLDPSEPFGGVRSVTFEVPEAIDAKTMMGKTVTVTDSVRGTFTAVVAAVSGDRVNAKVDAHSRMSALVANRTALPHVGTLESALLYYFGLVGITTDVLVDPEVADIPVVAPGWYGNVWEHVKKLCVAYQVEPPEVGTEIVVRAPRAFTLTRERESAFNWALDESQLAQTVEAWFYPAAEITDALVVGNELSPVSNLGAGELHEFDVSLPASLSSVVQPVAADSVSFDESAASVYAVVDQFDVAVPAAEWVAGGGRVTVEISEDTRSLHVSVVGSQDRIRAPYRLSGFALSGHEYSTIRVIGTGVSLGRELYTLPGASSASAEVGASVDNPFLGSWGHAHTVLRNAAATHGAGMVRISGAAAFAGEFGNLAGSRILEDYAYYRVRSVNVSPSEVSYAAEADTTHADVDAVWDGYTVEEWDALWADRPIPEFDLRPLTPLSGEVTPPGGGLYPGSLTFPSSTTFPGA